MIASIIGDVPGPYGDTAGRNGQIYRHGSTEGRQRRHGSTGWLGRQWDIRLPLDFLAPGKSYRATIFRDGINADHNAEDYVREVKTVDRQSTLEIRLASGGGCVIKIETIK